MKDWFERPRWKGCLGEKILAKTCRRMKTTVKGIGRLGPVGRGGDRPDCPEFFRAPELSGTTSPVPCCKASGCPHSREAQGERYSSVCRRGFVGKRGDPCRALVKWWSNHNLFSLGPNWSPDGLISRVRHYSPPLGPPPACFSFPAPFKSCKISIWKSWEALLLES